MTRLRAFLDDESGVTAIEYALIGGSICVVIVVGVAAIGTRISSYFGTVSNGLR